MAPSALIRVVLGTDRSRVLQDSRPELLRALEQAGISPTRLAAGPEAEVVLMLPERGWEPLNLGALIAAQRARGSDVLLWAGQEHRVEVRATAAGPEPVSRQQSWLSETGWHPLLALLDRDGTVIEDRHYLHDPEAVALLPGAVAGLRLLAQHGIPVALVTNQSGVARGLISMRQVTAVNDRLEAMLLADGVRLAGVFTCPHAPEDGCRCRKPEAGLAQQAGKALGVDPARAVVAGDQQSDLDFARRIGAPAILVSTGSGRAALEANGTAPDYLVDHLAELAAICTHPTGLPFPANF